MLVNKIGSWGNMIIWLMKKLVIFFVCCAAIILIVSFVGDSNEIDEVDSYSTEEYIDVFGATDEKIKIHDNDSAQNQNMTTVLTFLFTDHTERMDYNETFKCGEFAKMLHDNAEMSGIRCGFVEIWFEGKDDGHACCAFEITTSDKLGITKNGILYVDCNEGENTYTIFDNGTQYEPVSLRPIFKKALPESLTDGTYLPKHPSSYYSIGTVESYSITW